MRARIVLAVAGGEGPAVISARLGVSRPTVTQWRDHFLASGLEGLNDAPRSGRPKTVDDAAILAATLEPPPAKLSVTHWSTRLLAGELRRPSDELCRGYVEQADRWTWLVFAAYSRLSLARLSL